MQALAFYGLRHACQAADVSQRASAFRFRVSVSGCLQAIYHAKPIISLPFFGDQSGNADKLINRVSLLMPHPLTLHLPITLRLHTTLAARLANAGCLQLTACASCICEHWHSSLHILNAPACLQQSQAVC